MNSTKEISQYLVNQGEVFSQTQALSEDVYRVGLKMVEWWQEGRIFLG